MPWCPKCKNEYVEGITKCADCGCELVETLEEAKEPLLFGEQEQMTRLMSFLSYNGIVSASMQEDEAENVYELFVAKEELARAKQIAAVFLHEDAARAAEVEKKDGGDIAADGDESGDDAWQTGAQKPASAEAADDPKGVCGNGGDSASDIPESGRKYEGVYKESAQKAAEFKDSAYTLIGVGVIGLIAVLAAASGMLPFPVQIGALFYGVMGSLFVIFIAVGVRSMSSAKRYKKEAATESSLKDEIMNWCRESIRAEEIDAQISEGNLSEEEKYFRRTELIKGRISEKFLNIEEGFLDHLVDEFYPELFE